MINGMKPRKFLNQCNENERYVHNNKKPFVGVMKKFIDHTCHLSSLKKASVTSARYVTSVEFIYK